jgi:uncharacterized protein YuzE
MTDADTLYISFGKPRAAGGADVGEGVVVRYDEKAKEVVGLTILALADDLSNISKKALSNSFGCLETLKDEIEKFRPSET